MPAVESEFFVGILVASFSERFDEVIFKLLKIQLSRFPDDLTIMTY